MKTLVTFLGLSLFFAGIYAETNLELNIFIESEREIESVAIFNFSQNYRNFDIPLKDAYTVDFAVDGPDYYTLIIVQGGKPFQKQFWLDAGKIEIRATLDESGLSINTVIGSPTYDMFLELVENKFPIEKEARKKALLERIQSIDANPYVLTLASSLTALAQNDRKTLIKLRLIMEKQAPLVKEHIFYEGMLERLTALIDIKHIDLATYWFLNEAEAPAQLPEYKEDIRVLDLWFVACPPCVADHKRIKEDIESRNFPPNVELIGISNDQDVYTWQNYLEKHPLLWRNYILDTGTKDLIEDLGVSAFPTYVVLNRKGKILANFNGYQKLKEYLLAR